MSEEIAALFGPGLAETTVIRNGIEAARWPFARRRPRSGPPKLLYVGRLEYEKGVHEAIAALPRIRRAHPGTTLTIAGEGTQQEWLVEQARKHRVLKATHFVGQLDHDDLLTALHSADAAVLPSHYEPFGLAALEAAAAGTPLVTSNIGGLGEAVINGETGMSCPPREVGRLAKGRHRGTRRSGSGTAPRAGRAGAPHRGFRLAHGGRGDRAGLPGGQACRTPNAASVAHRRARAAGSVDHRPIRCAGTVGLMGLEYSSVIDAPIYEVFDWHARPGAFARLTPPWSPMRLIAEADSLENGRAELGLPGGLRWVADHQPDGYDPPRRFVDAIGADGLASLPAKLAVRWRHTHDFEEVSGERTRVIDRVETPVPAAALRSMFPLPTPTVGRRHRRAPGGGRPRVEPAHRRHHRCLRARRHAVGRVPVHRRPPGHPTWCETRPPKLMNDNGIRMIPILIYWPGSTRWSTSRAPRSRADSPTTTARRSATAGSLRLAGWLS